MGPQFIQTMIVFAFFPYINFLIFFAIRLFRRFLDSGMYFLPGLFNSCKNKHTTKSRTITQYVELYSGQEIFLHFKYSNFMNIVFIAFTNGITFPVLWPIALVGLINNYFVERVLLAYYYKLPPVLDNIIDKECLKLLRFAPIPMLLNAYWALGNRQMFFNEYTFKLVA